MHETGIIEELKTLRAEGRDIHGVARDKMLETSKYLRSAAVGIGAAVCSFAF